MYLLRLSLSLALTRTQIINKKSGKRIFLGTRELFIWGLCCLLNLTFCFKQAWDKSYSNHASIVYMDKKHKSVSTILGQEKNKWTAVSLAWSTGVLNGKQLNATAHKRKKAAILQPDMQQAIYVSQKVRNVFPSEHAVAKRHLKWWLQLIKV